MCYYVIIIQIERTALHYAMSVDQVETMSTILIGSGANRIAKDLVYINIKYIIKATLLKIKLI